MQWYGHAYSLGYFCKLFGKSRQAFYEQKNVVHSKPLEESMVLKWVLEIRKDLPRCGTSKLYESLKPRLEEHNIKLGRDALYRLLDNYGLLIRQRKSRAITTNSNHPYRKYGNLIKELVLHQAGELWVSDITYIRTVKGFSYLSIITDAYSHKVVGYKLHPTLEAKGAIDALMMASKDLKRTDKLIHHSDRGVQYCCQDYVNMTTHLGIQLSMTENGDPYENAMAERVNGILKHELLLNQVFESHQTAQIAVDRAIKSYNELRTHDSCDRLTPVVAHEQKGVLAKRWKKRNIQKKETKTSAEKVSDEVIKMQEKSQENQVKPYVQYNSFSQIKPSNM
jgi:transposase InsO family protein